MLVKLLRTMHRYLSSFKRNNRSTWISRFFWISLFSSISFIFASSNASLSFSIFSVFSLSALSLSSFFFIALSSSASDVSSGGVTVTVIGQFSFLIGVISKQDWSSLGLGFVERWRVRSAGVFMGWSGVRPERGRTFGVPVVGVCISCAMFSLLSFRNEKWENLRMVNKKVVWKMIMWVLNLKLDRR